MVRHPRAGVFCLDLFAPVRTDANHALQQQSTKGNSRQGLDGTGWLRVVWPVVYVIGMKVLARYTDADATENHYHGEKYNS